ncbi:O-antigen ligase family protein [Chryseobacterium indoltheticum]|uniref:O-Antigen ligase n=1 Tax=Chryseobacterium indoltheticum TaxID=254 RepID=A0A381F5B4_9FLAO|nr:O-antigen ligase family protein [Chryseobacterium indoltheticum]AZA75231.1 hypothetical protein EG358_16325 [Chryseobacterium indoltheticum]SIR15264.1 O-Antigen ligase [Chryseobacterium indoltheticum]SUX41725.1 Lipid A core - O-antigen ligase and related enzymes [Chryseobacterium indoltheticum]
MRITRSNYFQKLNRFDIYLMLLIFSQILGAYGGFFQITRVFSLILFSFLFHSLSIKNFRTFRFYIYFHIVFIIYSMFFLVFGKYVETKTLLAIVYGIINITICLNLIILSSKCNDFFKSVCLGIFLFLIVAIPLSFWEIQTNVHFITVIVDGTQVGGTDILRIYTSLFFGNYNNYNMVLMMMTPFLFSYMLLYKKWFPLIFLAAILYIFSVNGTRSGVIMFLIQLLLFLILSKKIKFLFFVIPILFFYIPTIDLDSLIIFKRFEVLGVEDKERSDLIGISIQAFLDSYFLGIGPNAFSNYVAEKFPNYIGANHNLLSEILSQYGLFIFLYFVYILIRTFRKFYANIRYNPVIVFSLIGFPFVIVVNSSYLLGVNIWIFLTVLLIINIRKLKHTSK